jgi:hypothetical protein
MARGTDVVAITKGLVQWILDVESNPIRRVVIDRGDQFRHNRTGIKAAFEDRAYKQVAEIAPINSVDHLLVQAVDLACYAAFLAGSAENLGKQHLPGLNRWYADCLETVFAASSGPHGIRNIGD